MLKHKKIVFPEVDLSHDEGDPEWDGVSQVQTVPIQRGEKPDHPDGVRRWIRPGGVCARAWEGYKEDWIRVVEEYEANPDDFHNAWHYLDGHPIYWKFDQSADVAEWPPNHLHRLHHDRGISRCVDIIVVRVNPKNKTIEDDESKNTATRVWYETGQMDLLPRDYEFDHGGQHQWHDWKIDGGAPTMEKAIIKLARRVWKKYGNDRRYAEKTLGVRDAGKSGNETTSGADGDVPATWELHDPAHSLRSAGDSGADPAIHDQDG